MACSNDPSLIADDATREGQGGRASTTSPQAAGREALDGGRTGDVDIDASDPDTDISPENDAGDLLSTGCEIGAEGQPLSLSCTGLYSDFAGRKIAPGVRSYSPAFHLWSDGAEKQRWIYLPPGTRIDTSNPDEWTFPVGTKFWKEFKLDGHRVETRLLWKTSSQTWYRTTYRWSTNEETARELTAGERQVDGRDYEIPSQALCASCHDGRRDTVLGFDAINLSAAAATGLDAATLLKERLLTDPLRELRGIPGTQLDVAALGYLHVNCGVSCHNRDSGSASFSGLFLRLEAARLQNVQATDTWTTGVNMPCRYYAMQDSPQPASIFTPCDPLSSIAYYRMSHRNGVAGATAGSQMPPLATHRVDSEGLATIANWLMSLAECT
jgi:hypothetical protein